MDSLKGANLLSYLVLIIFAILFLYQHKSNAFEIKHYNCWGDNCDPIQSWGGSWDDDDGDDDDDMEEKEEDNKDDSWGGSRGDKGGKGKYNLANELFEGETFCVCFPFSKKKVNLRERVKRRAKKERKKRKKLARLKLLQLKRLVLCQWLCQYEKKRELTLN